MRPGPLLEQALLYGIRTDTAAFERSGGEEDYALGFSGSPHHADNNLLRRTRPQRISARLAAALSRACLLTDCRGGGAHATLGEIKSADLLVAIADFSLPACTAQWIAVSGIADKNRDRDLRGDGGRTSAVWPTPVFTTWAIRRRHRNLGRVNFHFPAVPEASKPPTLCSSVCRPQAAPQSRDPARPSAPNRPTLSPNPDRAEKMDWKRRALLCHGFVAEYGKSAGLRPGRRRPVYSGFRLRHWRADCRPLARCRAGDRAWTSPPP